MERRTFLGISCSCGVFSLFNTTQLAGDDENIEQSESMKKHVP